MSEKSIALIEEFVNICGPSGFEEPVLKAAEAYAKKENLGRWERDAHLNGYLYQKSSTERKKGERERFLIALDCHTDEVGFMVQSIKSNGLMPFVTLGGWVPVNLPSTEVQVRMSQGAWARGVIGTKPPHFMTEAEKKSVPTVESLAIDIGASSAKQLDEMGIRLGAPVVPYSRFSYDSNLNMMRGKAFDNRLGAVATLEIFEKIKRKELNVDVAGVFSAQEEVGLRGAAITAERVKPDMAIVLEGTPSDDFFIDPNEAQGRTSRGVQVRFYDPSHIANPRLAERFIALAKEREIPHQVAVRRGGGTDAGKIHLAAGGIPTVVLGVPIRYVHTGCGFASFSDYCAMVDLATAFLEESSGQSLW